MYGHGAAVPMVVVLGAAVPVHMGIQTTVPPAPPVPPAAQAIALGVPVGPLVMARRAGQAGHILTMEVHFPKIFAVGVIRIWTGSFF